MSTISTRAICNIVGLHIPVIFLKNLGFNPVFETSNGSAMWDEMEIDSILLEIGLHFINKSRTIVDPKAPYGYKKNGEPSKKRGRPIKSAKKDTK